MRNIILLIKNALKVTFRKKVNIFVYLLLPLVGIFVSMLMYNGSQTRPMDLGFIDKDKSMISIDTKAMLESMNSFKIHEIDESEINNQLLDRKLDAVVIIPEGFSLSIENHNAINVELISIKGQDTTLWIENYLNLHTRNLMDISLASDGDKAAFERIYAEYKTNKLKLSEVKLEDAYTGKLMTVTSMGFLIMFVMLGAGLTSQMILNEKRNRTYHRICSAPVSSKVYIAANTITSLVIICIQNIIILFSMKYLFRIETFVPGPIMFVILTMFGTAAIGISLLVAAYSSTSYMAGTLNTLILTPTCMLGGCFWPVSLMPEFMRKISYFVPQRWALEAIQKLQTGKSYGDIAINLIILASFAAAMFILAAYRFSRTENVQRFV